MWGYADGNRTFVVIAVVLVVAAAIAYVAYRWTRRGR